MKRFALRFPLLLALAAAAVLSGRTLQAQTPAAQRTLGREDIKVYGIGLTVAPATQTVPKDIATIVSTFLQASSLPDSLPPFAPDAEVVATLRGPSFAAPVELRVKPNTPFNIPPLTIPGTHVVENIRLVSGGEVLLRATPDHASIDVIEKLLVTQVTARALTAAEIREKGIVFDKDNYQAYNFSAAFAIADQPINLNFPVVLPRLEGASDTTTGSATIPAISAPGLPTLQTIIPDTLKLQTKIPNLSVVGFTLQVPQLQGQSLLVPPIPGVVVIPGDIGFLNQYFSVMLMVGNVAPTGSNLVVTDLKATIVLPPGNDNVANSADDPLRMAQTTRGESPRIQIVAQPGPDGKVGTADDIPVLSPGDSGNAEYLVEGRREGSHVVEMQMTGTLSGLPVGPVTITGRAAGAVLVRNPKFSLTFTHPDVVSAGEPYTLDVTVTNTSQAPANFVSLNLYPRNVSGATIVGDSSRGIESIPPGDSETISFSLVSRISGKVTAATLDSDENVNGHFLLKAAVGELGVPLSPDSLVLPKEANVLPDTLKAAALGMLGKAHAVATAPAAALPPDVRRFSRKIVIDRAVQVAEAGLRVSLHEPLAASAAQLLMDFAGSDVSRLATLYPSPSDQAFEKDNFDGFDELRRRSVRGDRFADAVAAILAGSLSTMSADQFLSGLAQSWSYRPGFVAVLVSGNGMPLPARFTITDAQNRRVGSVGDEGKVVKDIPYSDLLDFTNASGETIARLMVLAAPQPGSFRIAGEPVAGAAAGSGYVISIVSPGSGGVLTQATSPVLAFPQYPQTVGGGSAPYTFTFPDEGGAPSPSLPIVALADPAPTVMSVVQQADADVLRCDPEDPGAPAGRVLAVLFSEEVTPASVQDRLESASITNFTVDGNKVVGVALQPGRRIAFIALRDPFGPFVPRQITITSVQDGRGQAMSTWTGLMEPTVGIDAGVVSGRVLNADGTPVPYANVRLFSLLQCDASDPTWIGISSKPADANGRYQFDYVTKLPDRIVAVNQETGESRSVRFNVQRDGQRLNVDIVYLGRGTFTGTTFDERGRPLASTALRISSLTDGSEYGAQSDANGRFSIPGVPVGNVFVEAVHVTANAQFSFADFMPAAGSVVERDITLLDVQKRQITVKQGAISGHVLRADGTTGAAGLPVIVWYRDNSQQGVRCPGAQPPLECAIAMMTSDAQGAFAFTPVTAGELRVSTFDQGTLTEGQARTVLAADTSVQINVLLAGGLGTVKGVVLDSNQTPVAGALVGGGLSLATTDGDGQFTLADVPLGRREIVAVSEALGTRGTTTVDLVEAGQTVNATITFDPVGTVSGVVVAADGLTPVPNVKVYLFSRGADSIVIAGSATTNASGGFQIPSVRAGSYELSAFNAAFTDGNVVPAVIKYQGQTFRTTIRFRGAGGTLTGKVLDDDGVTPLKARVGVSGDQVVVASGTVGVGFQRVNYFKVVDTDLQSGTFTFNNLFVGPLTVSAVGQFSPDPVSVDTAIPAPNATVAVELELQATSEIRGVVLLPDGVHPAGANLLVKYKSEAFKVICSESAIGESSCESIPQGIQEENAVTDAQGRFWFPIVNAGPFSITAEDPVSGHVARIQGSVRPGETADLSVRLFALADVTVQVFGSNTTTAIGGARVELRQLGYPQKTLNAIADVQGAAQFTGGDAIAEGAFLVTATDPSTGFAGRASGAVQTDGQPIVVKVYLYNAAGTVAGTVFAPDGFTPVQNAEVIVSGANGPLAFAVTGDDGTYSVGTVPIGPLTVDVFEARTGRRGAATGRMDANGQTVTIDVVEAAVGLVKGQLLQVGTLQPLKGWQVSLSQQSPAGLALPTLETTTGVDGRFSFPGTTRGTFSIVAGKRDVSGRGTARGWIETEGQVMDVPVLVDLGQQLSGGISGIVVTSSGAPVGNAALELCLANGRCGPSALLTTSAADGTFVVNDVPLGRFSVIARTQGSGDTGSAYGEVAFDGDVASVTVVLSGLAKVSGQVVNAEGFGAGNIQVQLRGFPSSGCAGDCSQSTDGSGNFSFIGVAAKTFTVTAIDTASGLKGTAGGSLQPGEDRTLRIVLEPTAAVSGRVLTSAGVPAHGAVAELVADAGGANERHLFAETAADGTFTFAAAPMKAYELLLSDPIGPGVAARQGTVAGPVSLGDIVLDEAPPQVASLVPASASRGVQQDANIVVTFTEPILPGTINAANIALLGPDGPVTATLDVTTNDTVVVINPLQPLKDETSYTLRIKDVKDRVQKAMPAVYTATFTTLDVTPPAIVEASPAANISGVTIYTPIRIKFSEAIDSGKFGGAPIAVSGPSGAVAGTIGYLFGNTVIVFTPAMPLAESAIYQVTVKAATDLNGRAQQAATTYSFSTTTRTPPTLAGLTAANDGKVIRGGIGRVTAEPGSGSDVLFVDFYVNGTLAGTDRKAPFELAFQVTPQLGDVGSAIEVTAVPTDTSGNRGLVPASAQLTIVADQPPSVTLDLAVPGGTLFAKNGDRIVVTVTTADDLGVAQLGYRAVTGNPADASTEQIAPAVVSRTSTFAFYVPSSAAPGSIITVEASAVDTAGQVSQAATRQITVVDAVAPVVEITGATTGATLRPGQSTTIVVIANDVGGIKGLTFSAGGLVTRTDTRTIEPPQNAVVASFTVTVPTTARAGDTLTLDATATDRSGNSGSAARVILPIADATAPTVTVHTASGSLEVTPGQTVPVVVGAEDEGLVTELRLAGAGAFTFTSTKQVTPPSGSASRTFDLLIPANLAEGSQMQLTATAVDLAGNVSTPATLTLTTVHTAGVTLPSSQIVRAGESVDVQVELPNPAPAGGVRVDFTTDDAQIATATPSVQFAEGQTAAAVTISGIAGGNTTVRALIQGVLRATMTVTVSGGIVRGTVYDSQLHPVGGVQLTISGGGVTMAAVSEPDGTYGVEGIVGPSVGVKALDPETRLRGFASGTMTQARGSLRGLNVVLIPAVAVEGTVFLADGTTPAGAGARVDISETANGQPLATTFTDADSHYEFPLVTLGQYVVEASATDGNRGRAAVSLVESGAEVELPIVYLGYGTVRGVVKSSSGNTVANAALTLRTWDAFGAAAPVIANAEQDGTFAFTHVPLGSFSIDAVDTGTGQAGTAAGSITQHLQEVTREIVTAAYASLHGTVFRADGQTPVVGARVSTGSRLVTTNELGAYRFDVLPLGNYQLQVSDPGTRGMARRNVTLQVNGQDVEQHISLEPQGRLFVTVLDAGGAPVPNAAVQVTASNGVLQDAIAATAGGDGTALIEHVLAGTVSVRASSGALGGTAPDVVLAPDALEQITVNLQPTGTITGIVYEPGGQTPATSGEVRTGSWPTRVAPIGPNGVYTFALVPRGQHYLTVYDGQGRRRAHSAGAGAVIDANGQTASENFEMVGLGTVKGRVVYSDGQSAQSFGVTLRSLDADFGGYQYTSTDGGGFYTFEAVPVGDFVVSTGDSAQQLLGEATGTIAAHEAEAKADIVLQNNAVTLPRLLTDGNSYQFDIQRDGSLADGSSAFGPINGDHAKGASELTLVGGGTAIDFVGDPIGTIEEGQREIATRQNGIHGLSVTRKIYVPNDGYFARALELLTNPGDVPVTVDVRIDNAARPAGVSYATAAAGVVSTSSGDQLFAAGAGADRWVVIGQADHAGTPGAGVPARAFVVEGPGAVQDLGAAQVSGIDPTTVVYEWQSVVVPPGQTVGLLHFVVQQTSDAAAQAAAERLVQLPPEALVGLSSVERAAIRNFAVPEDGVSIVEPLPALTGTIAGRVLEGDASTIVPQATVRFVSSSLLYHRQFSVTAAADGRFTFTTVSTGAKRLIPQLPFTLAATYPNATSVVSPDTTGQFLPAAASATQDVAFTNTGMVSGVVRRAGGAVAPGGVVTITGRSNVSYPVAADASYRIGGLLPGSYTLTGTIPVANGSPVLAVGTADIVAGTTTPLNLVAPPTFTVSGTITRASGAVAVGVSVTLRNGSFLRQTQTTTGGLFAFADVPPGSYALSAVEPLTQIVSQAPVTVGDVSVDRDLSLVAVGSVSGTVTVGGSGAAGRPVTLRYVMPSGAVGTASTTTTVLGGYRFDNLPASSIVVEVDDQVNHLYGKGTGQLASDGQDLKIDFALTTNTVTLPVTLYDANGYPYDLDSSGAIINGQKSVFRGSINGAAVLQMSDGSGIYRFYADSVAVQELGGRQIRLSQAFNGMQVTRKIYVPERGYFARYVDTFTNPTGQPIPLTAYLANVMGTNDSGPGMIQATSTGDWNLVASADDATRDLWASFDDYTDVDPFVDASGMTAVGMLWGGSGAAAKPNAITYGSFTYLSGLEEHFENLVLQPGESIALMHFVVQQTSRAATRTSLERLAQLPPEALEGLTADERAVIRNFVVPVDGQGTLEPLGGLTGEVSGTVRWNDGTQPFAGMNVTLKSANPIFGRTYQATTSASGAFTFTGSFASASNPVAIALDDYTLTARVAATGVIGAAVGHFDIGQTSSTTDVVMASAGSVHGVLKRGDGTKVAGVEVIDGYSRAVTTDANGEFTFVGLPQGNVTLTAQLSVPAGQYGYTPLVAERTVPIVTGQRADVELTFTPAGRLIGTVVTAGGVPMANAQVMANGPPYRNLTFMRWTYTDAQGRYAFQDLVPGAYTVSVIDSRTSNTIQSAATIDANAETRRDVVLPAVGQVTVTVKLASGLPAIGSGVQFLRGAGSWSQFVTTGQDGRATLTNVTAGPVHLRAAHPLNSDLWGYADGVLTTENENVQIELTLPATGGVSGVLRTPRGQLLKRHPVQVRSGGTNQFLREVATDDNGVFSFSGLPTGVPMHLAVYHQSKGGLWRYGADFTLNGEADQHVEDITRPALASVALHVTHPDQSSWSGLGVDAADSVDGYFWWRGMTSSSGDLLISSVPEGPFSVRLVDMNTGVTLWVASGSIAPTDDEQTVPMAVTVGQFVGTISGRVLASDQATPIGGAVVKLLDRDSSQMIETRTTGADGTYTFANRVFGPGGFLLIAEASFGFRASATGTIDSEQANVVRDVVLPVTIGTVTGVVRTPSGHTLDGATITVTGPSGDNVSTVTAPDGTYTLADVIADASGVTVSADYPGADASVPVVFTAQRQTVTVDFTLDLVESALTVTVVAGDLQTRVEGAWVSVVAANGDTIVGGTTDATGTVTFDTRWVSPDVLQLYADYSYDPYAYGDLLVGSPGQTESATVTLPMSVVRGRVTDAQGKALNRPTVMTIGSDGVTHQARRTKTTGEYVVFGTAVGPFTLVAQDRTSGVRATVQGEMTSPSVGVVQDVVLPPTGTVTGTLTGPGGVPLVFQDVTLISAALGFDRWTSTDEYGVYTFSNVPEGPVSVYAAQWTGESYIYYSADGTVTAGAVVDLALVPPDTAVVSGTVVDANGIRQPFVDVQIEAFAGAGPMGRFQASTQTDGQGAYSFVGVPRGRIKIEARSADWITGGVSFATVTAATASVDVAFGTGVSTDYTLTADNGFAVTFSNGGQMYGGGSQSSSAPFSWTYPLYVTGNQTCCEDFVALDAGGRQLTFGPMDNGSGLFSTRKMFMPQDGSFIRYLEIIENASGVARRVDVTIETNTAVPSWSTRWVVLPEASGNTYMAMDDTWDDHTPRYAAVAHVMSGSGSVPAPARVLDGVESGNDNFATFGWQATVPAYGRVAFLHYAVVREADQSAAAVAEATALVDLNDPAALAGLSAEDRAAIVNFLVH